MNPISPCIQDQLSVDTQRKKLLVSKKCDKDAEIQETVSFIYYPSQRENPVFGHAELEIDGKSWTLLNGRSSVKSLSNMITSSLSGHGSPFFRVILSMTPDQLRDLRDKTKSTQGTCSMGVLKTLSNHGKYEVPLPIAASPLLSFSYLVVAKTLGSRRIRKIEFYGEQSVMKNLAKSIKGAVFEPIFIGSVLMASLSILIISLYTTYYLAKGLYPLAEK